MSAQKVLVFGPTGGVGGAAALEAFNRGAEVHLAMRDTKKATPNLPDSLPRVQADLTDPASIEKAVRETGTTIAFIYITFMKDMHPAAKALKKGGIKHVVLLSSFTVYPTRETAFADGIISKVHAEAEIALEDTGIEYTTVRPMYFANNLWGIKDMLKSGNMYLYRPDSLDDYIAREDIGAVAGAKLASGGAGEVIPLCGPQLISKKEAWDIVGEELGKKLNYVEITKEQFLDQFKKAGHPEMVGQVLVKQSDKPLDEKYPDALYKEASGNIKKYTGREPTRFREWVKKHKAEAE